MSLKCIHRAESLILYKSQFKIDYRPKGKYWTHSLLEESIGGMLQDTGLGDDFQKGLHRLENNFENWQMGQPRKQPVEYRQPTEWQKSLPTLHPTGD